MNRSLPGLPVHHQLLSSLKLMSIESVMPSNHLILCCPLFLLPPIPPSITVFSNESSLLMRWPKYWSFSFSVIPSKEHPGLISFRRDWLDLLAVQGTLSSLLQHHSSKASILRCSAFFTVQLSHPYMTLGSTKLIPQFHSLNNIHLIRGWQLQWKKEMLSARNTNIWWPNWILGQRRINNLDLLNLSVFILQALPVAYQKPNIKKKPQSCCFFCYQTKKYILIYSLLRL